MSYIAVDIGATNIRVAVGDDEGLKAKLSEVTDRKNGASGIPRQIARMIRTLGVSPRAIGIGSIGPIDITKGMIGDTPNFPFKNIPVVEPLKDEFHVPVALMNDCSAAVIGEHAYGGGKGIDNLFYVTMSTGLGGGAIVDGHPLGGKDGNAPEIGHIVIDPNSELVCGCGCRGHWEAYSSGPNIPRYAKLLLRGVDLKGSVLGELMGSNLAKLTSEILFQAAKQGDHGASLVVNSIGKINAVGFADIVNAFDPELITVGGSIALNNPNAILNPINDLIDDYLINRKPRIVITPLGADVVLYGGFALASKLARDFL